MSSNDIGNYSNLTDTAVESLRRMIEKSGLNPGETFANEATLAEKLKISRPILREAVNRLKAIGLLESKQGVGLIIGKADPVALFEDAFSANSFSTIEIKELAGLRYTIEMGVVDLVVKNISDEQLDRLSVLAEEIATIDESDTTGKIDELELEFHKTYLAGSKNNMLMRMHSVIALFFHRAPNELSGWDKTTENNVWSHRLLAQALRERNTERVRTILTGHLEGLYK